MVVYHKADPAAPMVLDLSPTTFCKSEEQAPMHWRCDAEPPAVIITNAYIHTASVIFYDYSNYDNQRRRRYADDGGQCRHFLVVCTLGWGSLVKIELFLDFFFRKDGESCCLYIIKTWLSTWVP